MSSRDMPDEAQGCFLVLAATLAFILSTFFTWQELRYRVWGEAVAGTLDEIEEVRGVRNRGWRVIFRFRDKNQQEIVRREFIPLSWTPPAGKDVVVHYIAGTDPFEVRLAGTENRIAPLFFGGTLLFLFVTLGKYYLEARRALATHSPKGWSPRQ